MTGPEAGAGKGDVVVLKPVLSPEVYRANGRKLKRLFDSAYQRHQESVAGERSAVAAGWYCGKDLNEAQEMVGYGQWGLYLKANWSWRASERTARNYQDIASNPDWQRVADLPPTMREALDLCRLRRAATRVVPGTTKKPTDNSEWGAGVYLKGLRTIEAKTRKFADGMKDASPDKRAEAGDDMYRSVKTITAFHAQLSPRRAIETAIETIRDAINALEPDDFAEMATLLFEMEEELGLRPWDPSVD
jgi:hypothetical protein